MNAHLLTRLLSESIEVMFSIYAQVPILENRAFNSTELLGRAEDFLLLPLTLPKACINLVSSSQSVSSIPEITSLTGKITPILPIKSSDNELKHDRQINLQRTDFG